MQKLNCVKVDKKFKAITSGSILAEAIKTLVDQLIIMLDSDYTSL